MRLLHAREFLEIVARSSEKLEEISKIIDKYRKDEGEKFRKSWKCKDASTSNAILDSLVMELSKSSSVSDGLCELADKFGLFDEVCKLDGVTAKVKVIDSHYEEIKQKLSEYKSRNPKKW